MLVVIGVLKHLRPSAGKDVEKLKPLHTLVGTQNGAVTIESNMEVLKN